MFEEDFLEKSILSMQHLIDLMLKLLILSKGPNNSLRAFETLGPLHHLGSVYYPSPVINGVWLARGSMAGEQYAR